MGFNEGLDQGLGSSHFDAMHGDETEFQKSEASLKRLPSFEEETQTGLCASRKHLPNLRMEPLSLDEERPQIPGISSPH